jgi:hypothetical protein
MNLVKLNNRYINTENVMHISHVTFNENNDSITCNDVRFTVLYNTHNEKIQFFNAIYPLQENHSDEEKDILLKKVETIREQFALCVNNDKEIKEIDKNINISKISKKD